MALEERRHPEAERLAEYADGVLDAESRAEVDQHLADCSDCRAVVMATMAFLEGQPATPAIATPKVVPFRPRRCVRGVTVGLAAAATLVLAVRVVRPEWVSGLFGPRADLPELQELIAAVAGEPTRPVEGRLSGGFKYGPLAVADPRRRRSRSVAGRPDCGGQDRKAGRRTRDARSPGGARRSPAGAWRRQQGCSDAGSRGPDVARQRLHSKRPDGSVSRPLSP